MQSCHTVDSMRTNDREESHFHFLFISLLDQGHTSDFGIVTRVLGPHLLKKIVIHEVDQIHVSRQKFAKEGHRPFFKGLWKDRMICVCVSVVHNGPRLSVVKLLFVKENSEKLNCRNGRVGIIELDLVFGSKLSPIVGMILLVASNYIAE